MAVMWPRRLPQYVTANRLRQTECKVFRQLEAVLDDSFVVFYSRPWLGLTPDGEEIDGECDFIVAHPKRGMLTLEVKGGAVACDPCTDRWTSVDRNKVTHNVKNPVEQAKGAKYEILKKLKVSRYWKVRRIRARHGVVLPHSSPQQPGDFGADKPQGIFCFAETFSNGFRDWILKRFGDAPPKGGRTKALGQDGVRALENILAKPFKTRTRLGTLLEDDDAALEVLTPPQFHILRAIEAVPRAAICGAAGTGKTVLAMKEARRCTEGGERTLFVCYNQGLATDVRHQLNDVPFVAVKTFHELGWELIRRARLKLSEDNQKKFDEETLPESMIKAFGCLAKERYDAIIVDEGQDFLPLWWMAVEAGLKPDGLGRLRIFYDNNQRVYASAINLPEEVDLVPIRLSLNLRNTRCIHELVRHHYTGPEIEVLGPDGVEVRWITVDTLDGLGKRISDCVGRLCSSDGVRPDDIAVLVATETAIEKIAPGNKLGGFRTIPCNEKSEGGIVVDSIRRFKGLERSVVVIAATPETTTEKELPYVAISRARTHLIIVGMGRELNRMRGMTAARWLID